MTREEFKVAYRLVRIYRQTKQVDILMLMDDDVAAIAALSCRNGCSRKFGVECAKSAHERGFTFGETIDLFLSAARYRRDRGTFQATNFPRGAL
jgi:hypothetical protein